MPRLQIEFGQVRDFGRILRDGAEGTQQGDEKKIKTFVQVGFRFDVKRLTAGFIFPPATVAGRGAKLVKRWEKGKDWVEDVGRRSGRVTHCTLTIAGNAQCRCQRLGSQGLVQFFQIHASGGQLPHRWYGDVRLEDSILGHRSRRRQLSGLVWPFQFPVRVSGLHWRKPETQTACNCLHRGRDMRALYLR